MPFAEKSVLCDSIKYANTNIKKYVETYSSKTIIKRNGKIKKNRKYDPEFARIIKALEESKFTFIYTDDGSSLDSVTLGLVESIGDGQHFRIIVPDHSNILKSENQGVFSGRGAILAEESYHAYQITKGEVIAGKGKGFTKGTLSIMRVEVDAKIWAANRPMTKKTTTINGVTIPSIASLIRHQRGNKIGVLKVISQGVSKTIYRLERGRVTLNYPPSYKF